MESPYKIKHWSPVKKIPKSIDGWGNVLEWDSKGFDRDLERGEAIRMQERNSAN